MSFVEKHFYVLKELSKLHPTKRRFIITNSGNDLIDAFSEIFLNLIHNSSKKNLNDSKTIRLIKKNFEPIGILIHSTSSVKKRREIIISNTSLQKLALTIGLSGYEFFKKQQSLNLT